MTKQIDVVRLSDPSPSCESTELTNPKNLNQSQVLALTMLGRTTVWRHIKKGLFPKPIKSGRNLMWSSAVIDEWLKQNNVYVKGNASSDLVEQFHEVTDQTNLPLENSHEE